jgi:uncharacterized membrane protein YgdD (TMEM256/DUF423 family)
MGARPVSGPAAPRVLAVVAGLVGALGVAAGAFGAHGLRARVGPDLLAVWETAARYHLLHAVALLVLAAVARPERAPYLASALFTAGIVLFSGSLYAMTLTGARSLGAITPLGGLLLIAGWIAAGIWLAQR